LLRRNFHAVRVLEDSMQAWKPAQHVGPLVIYLNHPSWWDPVVGFFLAQVYFGGRRHFAPIDAAALQRYRFLGKLGLFGVAQNSARGAAAFLRVGRAILHEPDAALWITAQGEFTDVRARPVVLRQGVGHLARDFPTVAFVPLAIEYVFWQERSPEVLLHFGEPVAFGAATTPAERTAVLSAALQQAQDALAVAASHRDSQRFRTLLSGKNGVNPFYDSWRWLAAKVRGQPFHASHEDER
jgi:1-acyl-sn-glycerol-3-phosphate acyltransferase